MKDSDSTAQRIRTTFERNAKALAIRPSFGQGTAVTKVSLREGLACEIEEGPWKLMVDMSEKSGGAGSAPNPGILGRGALGSCLTIGYALWAARLGVPLSSVEVEVQADYDSRGMYGIDGVQPGYRAIRYVVRVESTAPLADIMRVLDQADAHSDYLHLFQRAQKVTREIDIRQGGGYASGFAAANSTVRMG